MNEVQNMPIAQTEVTPEEMDSPSTAAVVALATSPDYQHDSTIYAATLAGLYRSSDGGQTWQGLELAAPNLPLLSVAVSDAGTEGPVLFVGAVEGGLLRGTGGGKNWSLGYFGGRQLHCASLALSPAFRQDGQAFAGTLSDGVFQSRNRGESFEARNFGLLDLNVLALAISPNFSQDETLYAATATGLYRSPNAARAWREVAAPVADVPVQCLAIGATETAHGILFAGTDGSGVYHSEDRGMTWHSCGTTLADRCINGLALSADFIQDQTVFALTDSELYVSRDGGKLWERSAEVPEGLCLAVTPTFSSGGPVLVGRAQQGVLLSSDLIQWQTASVVPAASH